jgi:hypothetical protein
MAGVTIPDIGDSVITGLISAPACMQSTILFFLGGGGRRCKYICMLPVFAVHEPLYQVSREPRLHILVTDLPLHGLRNRLGNAWAGTACDRLP